MTPLRALLRLELLLMSRRPSAIALLLLGCLLGAPLGVHGLETWGPTTLRAAAGDLAEAAQSSDATRSQLSVALPAELAASLRPEDGLTLASGAVSSEARPPRGTPLVSVEGGDGHWKALYRADIPQSVYALRRVQAVLRRGYLERLDAELRASTLQIGAKDALDVHVEDVSSPDLGQEGIRTGVSSAALVLWLAMWMGFVALTASNTILHGDRERGTGETLLTARPERHTVLLSKALLVFALTLLAGSLVLLGLTLAMGAGLAHLPTSLGLTPALAATLLPVAVVLAAQLSALFVAITAATPDARTGSLASAVALVGLVVAGAVVLAPGAHLTAFTTCMPVANLALSMRGAAEQTLGAGQTAAVLATTVAQILLLLGIAHRALTAEYSLIDAGAAPSRRARGQLLPEVLGLFAVAWLLTWFVGSTAQVTWPTWGTALAALPLALAGPTFVAWLGLPVIDTVRLRPPKGRDLALSVLAGTTAPALSLMVGTLQSPWLPTSRALEESLRAAVDRPLPEALLLFALVPAVAEELLCRGALLGLLRRALPQLLQVLVVALLFGALHMSAPRILPSATLGILLGYTALRSQSIWTAVVLHATHNAVLLSLTSSGIDGHWASWPLVIGASAASVTAVKSTGK